MTCITKRNMQLHPLKKKWKHRKYEAGPKGIISGVDLCSEQEPEAKQDEQGKASSFLPYWQMFSSPESITSRHRGNVSSGTSQHFACSSGIWEVRPLHSQLLQIPVALFFKHAAPTWISMWTRKTDESKLPGRFLINIFLSSSSTFMNSQTMRGLLGTKNCISV